MSIGSVTTVYQVSPISGHSAPFYSRGVVTKKRYLAVLLVLMYGIMSVAVAEETSQILHLSGYSVDELLQLSVKSMKHLHKLAVKQCYRLDSW